MKIAIAGATGFVGTGLVARLTQDTSNQLVVLSRDAARARRVFPAEAFPQVEALTYNPAASGAWQQAISGCDAVVNLAGTGIADRRWTESYKQEIYNSRIQTTEKLVEAIAQADTKPSVLVNASAIGYYGTSETEIFTENSPAGQDFLASVCTDWEARAAKVKDAGVRLVTFRLGIVLGDGGAIGKMLMPFKMFAGGPLGSGQQWFSWIHRDDLVEAIAQALTNAQFSGTYNATAPQPVRMNALCEALGEVLQRPSWLPVPSFALEALLGDGAQVVLEGQNALPERLQAQGFAYRYGDVKAALAAVVAKL
ncbi:MAG: TIGR01777 family oxidoreductase [Cyanobacteria bacterium J06641_5]